MNIMVCVETFLPVLIVRKVDGEPRGFSRESRREANEKFGGSKMLQREVLSCLELNFQALIWAYDEACGYATESSSSSNLSLLTHAFWKTLLEIMK